MLACTRGSLRRALHVHKDLSVALQMRTLAGSFRRARGMASMRAPPSKDPRHSIRLSTKTGAVLNAYVSLGLRKP